MKKKTTLALLLALLLLLPAGCGGSADKSSGGKYPANGGASGGTAAAGGSTASSASPAAPMPMPVEAPSDDGFWDIAEAEDSYEYDLPMEEPASADASAAAGTSASASKQTDLSEKIIYSANMNIETKEFDAAVAGLERLATEMGGFIESSQVSGYTNWEPDGTTRVVDRWASYVLRVPAGRLQDAIHRAGDLGSITNSGLSADNITSQFTDMEARKHSLAVQEERLLSMLERAEDVDTLIILESRLSEVRYEIESIERTLRNWQNQVDYSTLSVYLREVSVYTPTVPVQRTFPERLATAFRDGWTGFVRFLQQLVLDIVELLPMLVLLAVVIVAVVCVIRAVRRRRRARKAKKSAAEPKE